MTPRSLSAVAGLTLLLWIVPSVGTRGMGTIDQRVTHVDATLVDTGTTSRPAVAALLRRADAVAEHALGL